MQVCFIMLTLLTMPAAKSTLIWFWNNPYTEITLSLFQLSILQCNFNYALAWHQLLNLILVGLFLSARRRRKVQIYSSVLVILHFNDGTSI